MSAITGGNTVQEGVDFISRPAHVDTDQDALLREAARYLAAGSLYYLQITDSEPQGSNPIYLKVDGKDIEAYIDSVEADNAGPRRVNLFVNEHVNGPVEFSEACYFVYDRTHGAYQAEYRLHSANGSFGGDGEPGQLPKPTPRTD